MMVEILVAVSIIAIAVIAATTVTQKAVQVSRMAFHTSQATFLLEEGAEAVRILRDNGWTNISALDPGTAYYPVFSSGTWTLSDTPNTVGIFTRTVSVASVTRDNITKDIAGSGTDDPGTKLVTISVSWQEGGTVMEKMLRFYILDNFS